MLLDREFPPDIRVENEIDALIKKGHHIHLACFTMKNRAPVEEKENLTIHRKSISPFIYKSSVGALVLPFYFNFWKKFVDTIIPKNNIDAIHVHDLPLVGVGAKMKKKYHIKLTADLHENWPAYLSISSHINTFAGKVLSPIFLWRRFEKKVLKKADHIIVVVDEAKQRLKKLLGYDENIYVVCNTINLDNISLKNIKESENHIILCYAGGIGYHRGLQTVIKAFSLLENKNDFKFWILGRGSYDNKLKELVKKYGLDDNVIFWGHKPFAEMLEFLDKSNLAVIPHLKSEHTDSTIPHKLFQYMYLKKPVLASDCLPIKRIVEETDSGFIFESDNEKDLSELLTTIYNQKEMLDLKGENGKLWVEKKYNWLCDSEVLQNIYN